MIINLTPHEISIKRTDGTFLTLPKAELPARRAVKSIVVGYLDGIEIKTQEFGEVENLPESQKGVFLFVSLIVAQAYPERRDLVTPGTAIRNPDGTQSGCIGLSQVPE